MTCNETCDFCGAPDCFVCLRHGARNCPNCLYTSALWSAFIHELRAELAAMCAWNTFKDCEPLLVRAANAEHQMHVALNGEMRAMREVERLATEHSELRQRAETAERLIVAYTRERDDETDSDKAREREFRVRGSLFDYGRALIAQKEKAT